MYAHEGQQCTGSPAPLQIDETFANVAPLQRGRNGSTCDLDTTSTSLRTYTPSKKSNSDSMVVSTLVVGRIHAPCPDKTIVETVLCPLNDAYANGYGESELI